MYEFVDSSKPRSWISSVDEPTGGSGSKPQFVFGSSVSSFLLRFAIFEFIAIAVVSYLTSLVYSHVAWAGWAAGRAYMISALLLAAGNLFLSLIFKHFSTYQTQPSQRVLSNAATSVVVTFSFFLSGLFLLKATTDYSRATFLLQLAVVFASVLGIRIIAHARIRRAITKNRVDGRRAIIIGEAENYALVAKQLSEAGVKVVHTLPFPARALAAAGKMDRTELSDMIEACRAVTPDDIVIMTPAAHLPASSGLAQFLSELPVSIHLVPVDTGALLGSARLGELGALVTIEAVRTPLSVTDRAYKRLFDVVAAGIGLALLTPLLVFVAIAIKLDSRGPILFRQTRHGLNNDMIRVLKFRTMTTMEDGHAFTQAKKNDPRVTRVGRVLRLSNIDELPQLLNVLAGEMSIVGPRPHPVAMNQSFQQQISALSRRHNVKPGITGWAQVNGYRGETDTLEKMQRRFECDLYYIDNWSFFLDVKIILMTLFSKSAYRNAL